MALPSASRSTHAGPELIPQSSVVRCPQPSSRSCCRPSALMTDSDRGEPDETGEEGVTSKLDTAQAYVDLISVGGDLEKAITDYMSDDFENLDTDGNVALTKDQLLGMTRMLGPSFTGYGFVSADLREEDDYVIMTGHFEGTLIGDVDLSAMGLGVGVIPASGKKIVWPEASAKLTIEGGRIVRMQPYAGAAGLKAWLAALETKTPSA